MTTIEYVYVPTVRDAARELWLRVFDEIEANKRKKRKIEQRSKRKKTLRLGTVE